MTSIISPAQIDWRTDDNGNIVPVSRLFGDVYYSLVDGLAESRYVFIEQNHLPQRFHQLLSSPQPSLPTTFTVAELGFGTGLNFFATWQLWQEALQTNTSTTHHLHFISFEKFPLSKADFAKSLTSWKDKAPELSPLIDEFISNYPTLVAGCHRLQFAKDNLTLDLWLGDAKDNLQKLHTGTVDAWFLDGFAPSCNESLWAEQIFAQMARLSTIGTTVATFSCAGVVKRGLTDMGFSIAKVKGFGRKREMLTACLSMNQNSTTDKKNTPYQNSTTLANEPSPPKTDATNSVTNTVAVIGAGVSGLMSAWSLANRGFHVTLIDKLAPLAGASGNPRGVLAPKMTPLAHVEEHLHSIGYLYACRLYQQMTANILENTGVLDLMLKSNISCEQIQQYPSEFAQVLDKQTALSMIGVAKRSTDGLDTLANDTVKVMDDALENDELMDNQFLPQAGLINPKALAEYVLTHPRIAFQQQEISKISEEATKVTLTCKNKSQQITADHLVVCLAYESCQLDKRIFDFRKIRGQISWFEPTEQQLTQLPKLPLKYGGYCAGFTDLSDNRQQFLLGASFIRNEVSDDIREHEHQENRNKLIKAIPELSKIIEPDSSQWKARVSIRSQTPDYHPLVGKVGNSQRVWTLSGMGAKGFAFAPICAEILADLLTNNIPPVSTALLARLSPNRKRLQTPLDENR